MLYNFWLIISGIFGALNLRSIILYSKERNKLTSEINAKDTKIIMLEAKILYLETQLGYDNSGNRDTK